MTKRFTYVKNNSITQYQALPIQEIGKGKALHCQGVVDKLNNLSDENEQLKNEKESWKKSWIEEMEDQEEQSKCILKLVKENEKLKSTVKEVLGLLSDEVDLFSDKATEHDINAYVELKELDNKDAFYMATATKKAIKMLKELQE